ncbi:MAG: YihY family inner membrane protein [Bacteroidales bacterium]|nr:YihY family inner membrane protein [Bacteroidales bacterium]
MNIKSLIERGTKFVSEDIWHVRKDQMNKRSFSFVRIARVIVLAVKKYTADNCKDKASALTYYSVLSIVPLAAMAFGIAKAFGFYPALTNSINDMFKGHEEVAEYIVSFADSYLANIKGGLVAGIGFAMLIWTVMSLLGNTERTFNQIWETKKSRTIVRKFSDYISIILIAILAIAAYSSFTVNMTGALRTSEFQHIWGLLLSVSPCLLICLGLALVYFIMPTAKVKFSAAMVGGTIAGIAMIVTQFVYLYFQIGMTKNNAVYGSFAAIPLFLIWLQLSWHIVILGCEIAYAFQHANSYDADTSSYSISLRRKISIYILSTLAKRFQTSEKVMSVADLSEQLQIPMQLTSNLLRHLVDAGLVNMVKRGENTDHGYQPAFDINVMTLSLVISKIEERGTVSYNLETEDFKRLSAYLDESLSEKMSAKGQILVKDL